MHGLVHVNQTTARQLRNLIVPHGTQGRTHFAQHLHPRHGLGGGTVVVKDLQKSARASTSGFSSRAG
jgi:hypothetical protein